MPHTDISTDFRKNAAYGNGRIFLGLHENHGQHGGSCGFAVGSGNTDGRMIIFHDLPQQFGTGEHGNGLFSGLCKFRIVRMNGSCVDNHVNAGNNVGSFLSVENGGSFRNQVIGQFAFFCVGTGYGESFLQKDFGKTAHTDAANADKMYMNR